MDETEDNWEWVKEVLGVDVIYEEYLYPGKGFCENDDQFAVFKARSKISNIFGIVLEWVVNIIMWISHDNVHAITSL